MTAPGGGRTLADAFVRLRANGDTLRPDIKSQTEAAGADAGQNAGHHFANAMKKAIKAAAIATAVAGAFVAVKTLSYLKQAEQDASDLNETVSKAQNIFPKTQAALNKFAATSATALGLSRQQAIEGAASFGNFFNQIGIGEKQSLKMSTALIQLSADLGSFSNADPSEVMASFLSATRGEYDSLQKFIPTINAATVQTEALRLSHKKSAKDLTDADKALALYKISLRDAGKATGDFARTAGGQANATRTLKANLADIRTEIGTALMPVVVTIVNALNSQFVPAIKSLWATHGPQVVKFFQNVTLAMEDLIAGFNAGGPSVDGYVSRFEQIGAALRNLGPTLKNAVADVKAWIASQQDPGGPPLSERLQDAYDSLRQLLPLVKDFIAQLPSLNDLVNVAGTVLGYLADHTDELRAALPFLVAAVVAFKVAQLASNVAVAASPVFKVADYIATRRQTAAIREQTAVMAANRIAQTATTVATASNTVAENVSLTTRLRATAALIAQRTAMVVVRAATIAWTAVQWLLNAALTANPIGLIIAAIALLVIGIIYAYNHSETFRRIVQGAWKGIYTAAKFVVDWFLNTAWPFLKRFWELLIADAKSRIAFFINLFRTIQRVVDIVRDAFTRANAQILAKINQAIAWMRALPGRITTALGNLGRALWDKGRDLIQGFVDGIRSMADRLRDAIVGLLPGPLKRFAGMLGLASPSKLFYAFGRDTGRGFEGGLYDSADDVDAAIAYLAGRTAAAGRAQIAGHTRAAAANAAPAAGGGYMRFHPEDLAILAGLISDRPVSVSISDGVGREADIWRRGG